MKKIKLLCLLLILVSGLKSQSGTISLSLDNVTVKEALETLKERANVSFFFEVTDINLENKISVNVKEKDLNEALQQILKGQNLKWNINNKHIVISKPTQGDTKRQLKGTVVDELGEPLIGVSVLIKGTNTGTMTDLDGRFTLEVSPENKEISFSYTGFKSQSKLIPTSGDLRVVMEDNTQELTEIVVVGYGVQKKVNVTGAVSTIDLTKETKSRPITSLSAALSGMSAGMQIMQGSGQPNADGASIRIRGTGTLNDASPLILVDGLEQSISNVNPNDIATISVLKDAASSAIYGNRAANGVILITTKTGEKGKVNVNYRGLFSYNQPTNLIKMVSNTADYMRFMNESSTNVGEGNIFNQPTIDMWQAAEADPNGISESGYPNYVAYPNTDWYKAVFKNEMMMEHSLSVLGTSEKTNFNFSGTYLDNPGLIKGAGIKRYFLRSNITVDITNWLQAGTRIWGYQSDVGRNSTSGTLSGLGFQKMVPSIYPYYDGKYGAPEAPEEDPQSHNSLWDIDKTGGSYTYSQIYLTMFAKVKFLKDFTYNVNFDYNRHWTEHNYTTKSLGKYSFRQGKEIIAGTPLSELQSMIYNLGSKKWQFNNTLNWNKTIDKVHEIGALVGYEEMRYTSYNMDAQTSGLISNDITDLNTATNMDAIYGKNDEFSARSIFGRATYAYDSRYLFEMNVRYDGSSRFNPDRRWGAFPSFSAGWRISQEKFMQDKNIDNLKLRLSWGKLGNNAIGNYDWQSIYKISNYSFGGVLQPGIGLTAIANPIIRWESTAMANIGLDFGFLRNRLSGEIDVYNKLTDGILYRPDLPPVMGDLTGPMENIAEVTNKGVEFTLRWQDRIGDFDYSISANMAYNHNRVTKYKGELKRGWVTDENGDRVYKTNIGEVSNGGTNRVIEGRMINEFYMLTNYKGDASHFNTDGSVNINGGPRDGMIRTEEDMAWLKAMVNEGYTFYPNQSVSKGSIWYGDYIYADLNGDGIYGNSDDAEFQNCSTTPKYNFGLQTNVAWKGFDFSMNWAASTGFKIYWYTPGQNSSTSIFGYALPQSVAYDHYFYDPDNPNDPRTNIISGNPRLTLNRYQNAQTSTLHLENGNYLKLKNLSLGYTLPKTIVKKIYANNIRLFVSGENLLTITKFKGMDPEMGKAMGYALMRQYAFGVNVTF